MSIELLQEIAYDCPHCWQPNTTLLDLSAPLDAFIEDCRVCCHPVLLEVTDAEDGAPRVAASPSG